MDKIKDLMSKMDYFRVFLALYILKCLVISVGFADSLVLAVIASLYGFSMNLKRFEKKDPDAKLKEEIAEIKAALTKTNLTPQTPKKKFNF